MHWLLNAHLKSLQERQTINNVKLNRYWKCISLFLSCETLGVIAEYCYILRNRDVQTPTSSVSVPFPCQQQKAYFLDNEFNWLLTGSWLFSWPPCSILTRLFAATSFSQTRILKRSTITCCCGITAPLSRQSFN